MLPWRPSQFPAPAAAWRILDGRTTEQTICNRQLEAIKGCLLCREPTLRAKRATLVSLDHREASKWCWQENETHQSPLNRRAVQFAPRCRVNLTGLIQVSFVFTQFEFLPTNHSLVLRPTRNNSALSDLRLEPEEKTKFKLMTNTRSNFNLFFFPWGWEIFTQVSGVRSEAIHYFNFFFLSSISCGFFFPLPSVPILISSCSQRQDISSATLWFIKLSLVWRQSPATVAAVRAVLCWALCRLLCYGDSGWQTN